MERRSALHDGQDAAARRLVGDACEGKDEFNHLRIIEGCRGAIHPAFASLRIAEEDLDGYLQLRGSKMRLAQVWP
jgi:hypothetical protein